jgi:hypothetical protein
MADKRVVDAVRVTDDHATCPCGAVITLADPDDPPPALRGGKTVYLPQLVGIEWPQVRRRSAVGSERFHAAGELN